MKNLKLMIAVMTAIVMVGGMEAAGRRMKKSTEGTFASSSYLNAQKVAFKKALKDGDKDQANAILSKLQAWNEKTGLDASILSKWNSEFNAKFGTKAALAVEGEEAEEPEEAEGEYTKMPDLEEGSASLEEDAAKRKAKLRAAFGEEASGAEAEAGDV